VDPTPGGDTVTGRRVCAGCGAANEELWGEGRDVYCATCCDNAVYGPLPWPDLAQSKTDRLIGAALLKLEREGVIEATDKLKESARHGGPVRAWRRRSQGDQ
jgi:hypothetical protein